MISQKQLQASLTSDSNTTVEYRCQVNLNLYDSCTCDRLATQAAAGRYLKIISVHEDNTGLPEAVLVCLCEDDYLGWLPIEQLKNIEQSDIPYQAIAVSATEIQQRLPGAIAFAQAAMQQPNYYLWGGTVAPNYDCSGLIQAAFASVGIWLPRDSYQQEAFTHLIDIGKPPILSDLQPGDLIFFGTNEKTTHVALYLGDGYYIHSSGKEQGRNGIGIDSLKEQSGEISRSYYQQLRVAGRVVASYQPQKVI